MVMTVLSSRSMISATSTIARTIQRQRYAGGASETTAGAWAVVATADIRVPRFRVGETGLRFRTLFVTNTVRNECRSCQLCCRHVLAARAAQPQGPAGQAAAQPRRDRAGGARDRRRGGGRGAEHAPCRAGPRHGGGVALRV